MTPVIVVLDHLDDADESAWIEELELQGSPITATAPPEGFDDAPLHDQLALVRPLLEQAEVDALAWIALDAERAYLSVAFVGEGRAQLEVLDVPRDASVGSALALATRTLVAEVMAPPPPVAVPAPAAPTPSEPDAPAWGWQLTGGITVPPTALAGGVRPGVDAEVRRHLAGPVWVAAALGAQGNGHHLRASPRALLRLGPVLAGAAVDVAGLEWVTWAQPRLEVGVAWSRGLVAETRLRYAPQRDQVVLGDLLYDSGRIEVGVHLGWARQIGGR